MPVCIFPSPALHLLLYFGVQLYLKMRSAEPCCRICALADQRSHKGSRQSSSKRKPCACTQVAVSFTVRRCGALFCDENHVQPVACKEAIPDKWQACTLYLCIAHKVVAAMIKEIWRFKDAFPPIKMADFLSTRWKISVLELWSI